MSDSLDISEQMLEQVARRFHYLGEPFRLRILKALSSGEKSVGELVEALDANQPNISKHLQLLYDAGLVSRRKEGTSNLYAICDPMIFQLCDLVCRSVAEKSREKVEALQWPERLAVQRKYRPRRRSRMEEHAR